MDEVWNVMNWRCYYSRDDLQNKLRKLEQVTNNLQQSFDKRKAISCHDLGFEPWNDDVDVPLRLLELGECKVDYKNKCVSKDGFPKYSYYSWALTTAFRKKGAAMCSSPKQQVRLRYVESLVKTFDRQNEIKMIRIDEKQRLEALIRVLGEIENSTSYTDKDVLYRWLIYFKNETLKRMIDRFDRRMEYFNKESDECIDCIYLDSKIGEWIEQMPKLIEFFHLLHFRHPLSLHENGGNSDNSRNNSDTACLVFKGDTNDYKLLLKVGIESITQITSIMIENGIKIARKHESIGEKMLEEKDNYHQV